MKTITIVVVALSVSLAGCARKSDLDAARADLAEAQHQVETLRSQRVPRAQYQEAQASLKAADERIAAMERELQSARDQLAAQQGLAITEGSVKGPKTDNSGEPQLTGLVSGTYTTSNDTLVYSRDAQLKLGKNLQVSSPSGLMVSDSDQKIVGGDLSIKAKDVLLETSDGILKSEPDGSVKFTGTNLTMKFDDGRPAQPHAEVQPASPSGEAPAGTGSTP